MCSGNSFELKPPGIVVYSTEFAKPAQFCSTTKRLRCDRCRSYLALWGFVRNGDGLMLARLANCACSPQQLVQVDDPEIELPGTWTKE